MPHFTTIIHKEEDMFIAKCAEMGTVSQGFTMLVEGIHTVKIAVKLAEKFNTKMPLAKELYNVLFKNKDAKDALMEALM